MSVSFSRTLRSIREDDTRLVVAALVCSLVFLGGWALWLSFGRVVVHERSELARVEVDGAIQAIETPVSARVATSNLVLGRHVTSGEVLVELDATAETLERNEAAQRRDAAAAQVTYLERELAAAEQATQSNKTAIRAAIAEARAHRREAESQANLANDDATRMGRLHESGLASEMDLVHAVGDRRTRQAAAEATAMNAAHLEWSLRAGAGDRLAAIAELRREIARLEGEQHVAEASVERLSHEIERRKIRSPVAGRIGGVTVLREGSVVHEGARLASVIPEGELRVVASFPQGTAVGRVRRGQPARVRLTGFHWAEFGVLPAQVESVATEPDDGRIRAELRFTEPPPADVPLQHGLVGVVDVEVEHVAPLRLLLRSIGRAVDGATPVREQEPAREGPPIVAR